MAFDYLREKNSSLQGPPLVSILQYVISRFCLLLAPSTDFFHFVLFIRGFH